MSGAVPEGRVWKFGHDVCGDDGIIEFAIVAAGFGQEPDEAALRAMCFRALRPEFPAEVRPGDIVVGGRNFAHHNHVEVSVAIRASGIAAVLVESCEAVFIRRALNTGLPVMICPGIHAAVEDGEVIAADPATGAVTLPSGRVLRAKPFSERMVQIWRAGGAVPLLAQEFAARRAAASQTKGETP